MNAGVLQKYSARARNGGHKLLPLRNGEHLSRFEFEARWDATPGLKRAELIEGIVIMSPPISETHGSAHDQIYEALKAFTRATPGVVSRFNTSVRLDGRNEYQPDCLLRISIPGKGASTISTDDYLEGPPELVAEVAVSSTDYDAHEKRMVYERSGIQEYILWQVMDAKCDWWELQGGAYQPLKLRADGVMRSRIFPGLWLDLAALLAGNESRVKNVLERGLRSREHAEFVKRLKTK